MEGGTYLIVQAQAGCSCLLLIDLLRPWGLQALITVTTLLRREGRGLHIGLLRLVARGGIHLLLRRYHSLDLFDDVRNLRQLCRI